MGLSPSISIARSFLVGFALGSLSSFYLLSNPPFLLCAYLRCEAASRRQGLYHHDIHQHYPKLLRRFYWAQIKWFCKNISPSHCVCVCVCTCVYPCVCIILFFLKTLLWEKCTYDHVHLLTGAWAYITLTFLNMYTCTHTYANSYILTYEHIDTWATASNSPYCTYKSINTHRRLKNSPNETMYLYLRAPHDGTWQLASVAPPKTFYRCA